ncbi:MAG: hypothetical protein LRY50_13970 [Geovibrio sp.]|nr:hypothetical protein [Geovibrio sp.]
MRLIADKLLDLANLLVTGYLVARLFKPDFQVFWMVVMPISLMLYLMVIGYLLLEKKSKKTKLKGEKDDGE